MSGFEIVGVVLAVLPLLGSTLEVYQNRTKQIGHYEIAIAELISRIHVEHSRFRSSCGILVFGLVDDGQLESLLVGSPESSWKAALNSGLDELLRVKLDIHFHAYMSTVMRIARSLDQLQGLLGSDEKTPWYKLTKPHNPKWSRRVWENLKACLNHKRHMELLDKIDQDNTRLERLIPGLSAIDSIPTAMGRPRKSPAHQWEMARRSAMSLYGALRGSWLCECQSLHTAHFQLEDRLDSTPGSHKFGLAFAVPMDEVPENDPAIWQWVKIEAHEEEEKKEAEISNFQPGKRARFAETVRDSGIDSSRMNRQITDLCAEFHQVLTSSNTKCIGFISGTNYKHYIHCLGVSMSQDTLRSASLYEMLAGEGGASSLFPAGIELLDKYEVALLLASSLLELQATPWLEELWSTKDIQFIPNTPGMTLRECAFITRQFPPYGQQSLKNSHQASMTSSPRQLLIRNEAIFRLGVTLVELSLATPLEFLQANCDSSMPELADFMTAKRLLKANSRNNVVEWNNIITTCLHCSFHTTPDFASLSFRREFYEYVVQPLQKLCHEARSEF